MALKIKTKTNTNKCQIFVLKKNRKHVALQVFKMLSLGKAGESTRDGFVLFFYYCIWIYIYLRIKSVMKYYEYSQKTYNKLL